jgi:hypothetical protein
MIGESANSQKMLRPLVCHDLRRKHALGIVGRETER